jgi:hypothetical protein
MELYLEFNADEIQTIGETLRQAVEQSGLQIKIKTGEGIQLPKRSPVPSVASAAATAPATPSSPAAPIPQAMPTPPPMLDEALPEPSVNTTFFISDDPQYLPELGLFPESNLLPGQNIIPSPSWTEAPTVGAGFPPMEDQLLDQPFAFDIGNDFPLQGVGEPQQTQDWFQGIDLADLDINQMLEGLWGEQGQVMQSGAELVW